MTTTGTNSCTSRSQASDALAVSAALASNYRTLNWVTGVGSASRQESFDLSSKPMRLAPHAGAFRRRGKRGTIPRAPENYLLFTAKLHFLLLRSWSRKFWKVGVGYFTSYSAKPVAILEWKNWGDHCGAKEKSRGANMNVSPAWWFSIVMKIDCYD